MEEPKTPKYTKEQTDDLKLAETRYGEGKSFFETYNRDRFQRYFRNYRNDGQKRLKEKLQPYGNADWMSNIVYPLTSSYIDSVTPIIIENMPQLGVRPAKEKAVEYAKQINGYFQKYWVPKSNFNGIMGECSEGAEIYGVSYPILRWNVLYDIYFSYENGDPGQVSGKLEETKYLEYNDPIVENGDVFSTWPDGYARTPKDRKFVVCRYILTKEEAMNRYAYLYKNNIVEGLDFEEVFNAIPAGTGDTTDYSDVRYEVLKKNPERNPKQDKSNTSSSLSSNNGITVNQVNDKSEYVEVHTAQDIVIYCGKHYIGKIKNVFKELLVGHLCYKKPEYGIWGIGIAEELDIAHYYINVSINQESDVATLENFPMYAYDPNGGSQMMGDNLMVSPSRMFAMPPDAIKPIARGGSLNLSYKIIDFLKVAAREAVGIDETTRGSQLPSSTVATQINAIRESTNRRINNFISIIGEYEVTLMKLILKQGYLLYPTIKEMVDNPDGTMTEKEFIDLEIPVDDINKTDFYKIEKEAFSPKGFYRFTPSMVKSIEFSREANLRNSLDFMTELNRLIANDTVAKSLSNLDIEPVLKQIFENFGVEYSKPENKDSIANIKTVDAVAALQGGQPAVAPNELSQLPEVGPAQTMGQDLSNINQ